MRAGPNPLGHTRWGISVKTRLGGAVVRNRVKRRVREMLRRAPRSFGTSGWDLVVEPRRPEVATADFAGLRRELDALLEKMFPPGERA